jgi:prophage DNA circulation protein
MSWIDRLKEAAYTTPQTKERFVLLYEDVDFEVKKNTSTFDFPDFTGTYVQEVSTSGRRYPLTVFFSGTDYDEEADRFVEGLLEKGVGRLEHPVYGTVDVVPSGSIKRSDALKTAANQTSITVEFIETTGIVYPAANDDPALTIKETIEANIDAAAEQYASSVYSEANLDLNFLRGGEPTPVQKAKVKASFQTLLTGAEAALEPVAKLEQSVEKRFNAIKDSINNSIDVLVGDPLTLAYQASILIQEPARVATNIVDRLTAYRDLARAIFGQDRTDFQTSNVFASEAVSASASSAINTEFETQPQALDTAVELLDFQDELNTWQETNFTGVDTGQAYQCLQKVIALTAGFLVQISFTLKQERIVTLDRPRTIIDLAAELYGEVDEQLDFLIQSNDLTGSEIIELPAGRQIKYYV